MFNNEGEDRFDHKLTFPDEKNITYWSPQNEDGTVAEAAVIRFSLLRGDSMFLDEEDIVHTGTITLKRIGNKYRQVHLDGALPGGVSLTVLDPAGKPLLKAGGTAQ